MKNRKLIYNIITLLLFLIAIITLTVIDKSNNIKLSLTIQILLIVYLSKVTYGCLIHVVEQYGKQKYSYSIIMTLGFTLFLIINIFRQLNLLIKDWKLISINDIYNNTLNSFSYFAYFILPLIIVLAIYSVITNIVLIHKEGLKFQNILGILFGISITLGAFSSQAVFAFIKNLNLAKSQIYLGRFLEVGLNSILCYFYCLTLATVYCNVMAAMHKPKYDKDYVIILGSKIREDGTLPPILKARVDKAIEFANEQREKENRNIIFVPSGGKGEDEVTSEAEATHYFFA